MTLLQVNNWFINARRRILQPMLDGAGADGISRTAKRHNKSIKNTPTHQQLQHIAQQQRQLQQEQQIQLQQNSNSSSQGQIGGWQSDELASDSGSSDADDNIVDRLKDDNDKSDDDIH